MLVISNVGLNNDLRPNRSAVAQTHPFRVSHWAFNLLLHQHLPCFILHRYYNWPQLMLSPSTEFSPSVITPSIDMRARLLFGISTGQRDIILNCVFGALLRITAATPSAEWVVNSIGGSSASSQEAGIPTGLNTSISVIKLWEILSAPPS